jgi:hypothetical protein
MSMSRSSIRLSLETLGDRLCLSAAQERYTFIFDGNNAAVAPSNTNNYFTNDYSLTVGTIDLSGDGHGSGAGGAGEAIFQDLHNPAGPSAASGDFFMKLQGVDGDISHHSPSGVLAAMGDASVRCAAEFNISAFAGQTVRIQ